MASNIIQFCPHCRKASRIDIERLPKQDIRYSDRSVPDWVLRDEIDIKCPNCNEWITHEDNL